MSNTQTETEPSAGERPLSCDHIYCPNGCTVRVGMCEECLRADRASLRIATINDVHVRILRCLRSCVPNNAPLNTVLKYLDDAKRDALTEIKLKS